MKLKIAAENLLERIAIALNLVPEPLIDTQIAFIKARAIMAAAEIGIFEALGKDKMNAEQIAERCKTNPKATQQLLNSLVGIGYLKWRDNQYYVKPRYQKWLLKEYSSNVSNKLRFQITEWNWLSNLDDYLRTGKAIDVHSSMSTKEWSGYQDGMKDLSNNTSKELANKLQLPKNATKILDIGGSHGLYSIELCKKYPALSSTILELPEAIDRASVIASEYGLSDRIQYKAGNTLTDDLGEEQYDLIMIHNVVHHFTLEENIDLAKKVARALKPNGIYAIGEFIRRNKPNEGGSSAALADLYFAFTSASGIWSIKEMSSWQKQAGLKPQKTISLMALPGWKVLVAEK